jgi:hypothetical protein
VQQRSSGRYFGRSVVDHLIMIKQLKKIRVTWMASMTAKEEEASVGDDEQRRGEFLEAPGTHTAGRAFSPSPLGSPEAYSSHVSPSIGPT